MYGNLRKKMWHNCKEIKDIANNLLEELENSYENDKISKELYEDLESGITCIGHEIFEIEEQAKRDLKNDKENREQKGNKDVK